jgi:hypothetical protein
MSLVGPATEDRVILREDAGDLEKLPEYQESHYLQADGRLKPTPDLAQPARPVYWYPPIGSWRTIGGYGYAANLQPQD